MNPTGLQQAAADPVADLLLNNAMTPHTEVAGKLQAEVDRIRVHDPATRAAAATLRARLTEAKKTMEGVRLALVKTPTEFVSKVNAGFRALREEADKTLTALDAKIIADRREQERITAEQRRWAEVEAETARKKAEEEAAARAKEIAAAAETVAKDAGMSPSEAKEMGRLYAQDELAKPLVEQPVTVLVAPDPPKTIQTADASMTVKKVPAFEVVDPKVIPSRFLVVDRSKIELEMKAELRASGHFPQIAGVRFFYDDQVAGGRRR